MSAEEFRKVFDFIDRDRSGAISVKELRSAVSSCGRKISNSKLFELIESSSISSSGIDYASFEKFMQNLNSEALNLSDIRQLYYGLDLDSSGYLTAAELRHVMTNLGLSQDDAVVDQMVSLYDLDGNGELSFSEFIACLVDMGYIIHDDVKDEEAQEVVKDNATNETSSQEQEQQAIPWTVHVSEFPEQLREVMSKFCFGSEQEINVNDLKRAAELLRVEKMSSAANPEANPSLHWAKDRQKRGLGEVVYKANHIALIVSDVGRSASFYTDVMGFQQIRRPNFDKHGAWFTMGNLELHLIKGTPVVHSGEDLIVGHISIETFNIEKVPTILRKLGVPFRQNVSVPSRADAGGSTSNNSKRGDNFMRQYFIRDPDGYYVEICNCDVLTKYCLGEKECLPGYEEGVKPLSVDNAMRLITFMQNWTSSGTRGQENREGLIAAAKNTDGSIAAYAKLLGSSNTNNKVLEEVKYQNLLVRRSIYGDICQNESVESLKEILLCCGNDVPMANDLMKLRADVQGSRTVIAPAFFEQGETLVQPKSASLSDDL